MLFGAPEWISELDKLRLPYNIGTLNQFSAEFVIDNIDILEQQASQIRNDRESLLGQLESINAVKAWPSDANFILFRTLEKNANDIHQQLLQQNILIKNLNGTHPLLENCLRVTVGTAEENTAFISSLKSIIND